MGAAARARVSSVITKQQLLYRFGLTRTNLRARPRGIMLTRPCSMIPPKSCEGGKFNKLENLCKKTMGMSDLQNREAFVIHITLSNCKWTKSTKIIKVHAPCQPKYAQQLSRNRNNSILWQVKSTTFLKTSHTSKEPHTLKHER